MSHQNELAPLPKQRKNMILAFAGFLVVMWVFTLVSKSIYAEGLTTVETEKPGRKYVEHTVEAQGLVIQGGEQAVTALEGIRVKDVFVRSGDWANEGDPLFQVDMEDLKESMKDMELEIKKLRLQIGDAKANRELAEQKRLLEQQRALEDYVEADGKSVTGVNRAEEATSAAQQELQNHLEHPASVTPESERKQAWAAYDSWVEKQETLTKRGDELEELITAYENPEAGAELTEEEKAELEAAKKELPDTQEALKKHAEDAVQKPDFSPEDAAKENWEVQRKSLEDAAKSAQYGQDDAYTERNSTLKEAGRSINDAQLPALADSSIQINEMELARKEEQYAKYRKLAEREGIVTAAGGGMVTDIFIAAGDLVPQAAAMRLTDDSKPCQFKVTLDQDQKKYVKLGDTVEVKLDQEGRSMKLEVNYLAENENRPGTYEAYLDLPEDIGIPGLSGTLTATVSGELHSACIPIAALHNKDNQDFVFVVREKNSILGKELYAERLPVNVIDKNQKLAAIEEGVLDANDQLIIYSTQELTRGDIIRYQE